MGLFRRRVESTDDQSAAIEAEVSVLRQMLLHYPSGARPTFGSPTRCPSCGDFGLVNRLDTNQGAAFNECFSCGAQWVVTRRAMRALKEELETTGGVTVHDSMRAGGALLSMPSITGTSALSLPTSATDDFLLPASAADWLSEPAREAVSDEVIPRRRDEPVSPLKSSAGRRLDVLLVEDSELDAELIRAILAPVVPSEMSLYHASSSREGKTLFAHRTIDLVLLDLGLPDSNGLDTLKAWRHTGLPIAVVTGDDDLTLASAVRRAGAAEFVPKRRLAHLVDGGAKGTDELADIIRRAALTRRPT